MIILINYSNTFHHNPPQKRPGALQNVFLFHFGAVQEVINFSYFFWGGGEDFCFVSFWEKTPRRPKPIIQMESRTSLFQIFFRPWCWHQFDAILDWSWLHFGWMLGGFSMVFSRILHNTFSMLARFPLRDLNKVCHYVRVQTYSVMNFIIACLLLLLRVCACFSWVFHFSSTSHLLCNVLYGFTLNIYVYVTCQVLRASTLTFSVFWNTFDTFFKSIFEILRANN